MGFVEEFVVMPTDGKTKLIVKVKVRWGCRVQYTRYHRRWFSNRHITWRRSTTTPRTSQCWAQACRTVSWRSSTFVEVALPWSCRHCGPVTRTPSVVCCGSSQRAATSVCRPPLMDRCNTSYS